MPKDKEGSAIVSSRNPKTLQNGWGPGRWHSCPLRKGAQVAGRR